MADSDTALRQLAASKGILADWTSIDGQTHQVAPAVLRQILATFNIAANSDRQLKSALADLQRVAAADMPSLITAKPGGQITLPTRGKEQRAILRFEGEEADHRLAWHRDGNVLHLQAPRRLGYHQLRVGQQDIILAVTPARGMRYSDLIGGGREGERDSAPAWGLSAQVYSLMRSGDTGVGDYTAMKELAAAAAKAGASALAVSPVHAQFSADSAHFSPYSPSSRYWLNANHIDATAAWNRLLPGSAPPPHRQASAMGRLVDWPRVSSETSLSLRNLYLRLGEQDLLDQSQPIGRDYQAFIETGGEKLTAHALFEALQAHFLRQSPDLWHWRNWPSAYRRSNSRACLQFQRAHREEVDFHRFLQWVASLQLDEVGGLCRDQMSIGLISDIAVGSDGGGSQAWAHRADMLDGLSIGAPPDDFNADGQNWGVTSFSPMGLSRGTYRPFLDLIRSALRYSGGLRLDHILGLGRLWVIPEGAKATEGAYLNYPLKDLLRLAALESKRAGAFILGEDLGTVPPGFRTSLQAAGIAGMQVLWFERQGDTFKAPANWAVDAVGMTTTHDLPTVAGWWRGTDLAWRGKIAGKGNRADIRALRRQRQHDRLQLWKTLQRARVAQGPPPGPADSAMVVDAAIALLGKTACGLVLLPLEDLLALPEQPNLPGTIDQHPNWRRRLPATIGNIFDDHMVKRRLSRLDRQRRRS